MKKIKKLIVLATAFAMPNIASPATCNCYSEFNTSFNAANQMYWACANNYYLAAATAWATYYTSGGGVGGAVNGYAGLQNCTNTFYTVWDQLGQQFDYCIANYCN